jgi:predicted negative regulator of RcsB-dependent stress response
MSKNQKGFSAIEGLLIFIIVGIIAGVGWYVWDSNKKTNDILNSADKSSDVKLKASQPKNKSVQTDETANWFFLRPQMVSTLLKYLMAGI